MSTTASRIPGSIAQSEDGQEGGTRDARSRPILSVVVAVFNEQENLLEFRERIGRVIGELSRFEVELIFVDDGSRDGSLDILRRIHAEDPRFKVLRLSRNFGSWNALVAGVRAASGDAVMWISSDLQDPPEVIPSLVRRWEGGADVVWAVRAARHDPWPRRFAARLFYRLIRVLGLTRYPPLGMDLCLMSRSVAQVFRSLQEQHRFTQALVMALGFSQDMVPYVRESRRGGRSSWGRMPRLFTMGIDMVVAVSYFPLRLPLYLGVALGVLAGLLAAVGTSRAVFGAGTIEGWQIVMWVALAVGALNLMVLGVLGEYVWRVLENVRGRPMYVIQERIGFEAASSAAVPQASEHAASLTY